MRSVRWGLGAFRLIGAATLGGAGLLWMKVPGMASSLPPLLKDAAWVGHAAVVNECHILALTQRLRLAAVLAGLVALCFLVYANAFSKRLFLVLRGANHIVYATHKSLCQLKNNIPLAFTLGALVLLSAACRIVFLGQQPSYDEAYTVTQFVNKPLWFGLSWYPVPNNHPFNTLCAHISTSLFGQSLWAARLPALLFSLLLVPLTYVLWRLLGKERFALIATALTSTFPVLVTIGVSARGYPYLLVLATAAYALCAAILRRPLPVLWTLLALCGAWGMYCVPLMLYPLSGAFLWLAWEGWRASNSWHWWRSYLLAGCGMVLLTLLVYAPFLIVWKDQLPHIAATREPVLYFPGYLYYLSKRGVETWQHLTFGLAPRVGYLLAGFVMVGTLACAVVRPRVFSLIAWSAFSAVALVLVQQVVPQERFWYYGVVLGAGAAAVVPAFLLGKAAVRVLALVLSVGLGTATIGAAYSSGHYDYCKPIAQLSEYFKPSTVVVADFPLDAPIHYALIRGGFDSNLLCVNNDSATVVLALTHRQRHGANHYKDRLTAKGFSLDRMIMQDSTVRVDRWVR